MSNEEKHYSDREVRKILELAVEIQKKETQESVRGGDLSLEDLRAIASEFGLIPIWSVVPHGNSK